MQVALGSFPLNFPLYIFYLIFLQVTLVTPSLPGPPRPAGGGVVAVLSLAAAAGLQAAFLLLVRPGWGSHGVRSYRDDSDSLLRLRLLAPAGGNYIFYNSVRSD